MISIKEIEDLEGSRLFIQGVSQDESSLLVELPDRRTVSVPIHLLQKKTEETYLLPLRFSDLEDSSNIVIPVIEEQPRFRKRKIETGSVRIKKTVHETPRILEETLSKEEISIERRPCEKIVDEPAQARQEGDTWILPVQEEILVVTKRILIREEIYVRKQTLQHKEKVTAQVRKEEVVIDRKKIN